MPSGSAQPEDLVRSQTRGPGANDAEAVLIAPHTYIDVVYEVSPIPYECPNKLLYIPLDGPGGRQKSIQNFASATATPSTWR